MRIEVHIDGNAVAAAPGWSVLRAAQEAGVYVPSLCAHPDLPAQRTVEPVEAIHHGRRLIAHDPGAEGPPGCGLCVVREEREGDVPACATEVRPGMVVHTAGAELTALRRERLARILAEHPHACLTCAQAQGCTREPCSMDVPVAERCCSLFGRCELQAVADHIGIAAETPRYVPAGEPRITGEPLFEREPELCIACGRCVRACDQREVHALGWVRETGGRRRVGPRAPTPIEAGCRLCGSCVEVCPTGALMDRGVKPAERADALVPCRAACPAATDVPRYVRLAAAGRLIEAAAVVAERAPLVEVLGHVCFHPCEIACRRNDVNGAPISICRIKREAGAASAMAWTERLPAPRKGAPARSVAVVGGGPAGLTAAHALRLLGHRVTLFEAGRELGGMLVHGIPAFRLPRAVVARETAALARGIEVCTEARVGGGNGLSLAGLRASHDAVVVATGAGGNRRLGLPGEELPGVRSGLDFLRRLAAGELEASDFAGRAVAVVGGGNVAMDCARAALRLGAEPIDVVCLEQPDEMLAFPDEVARAKEEGVRFRHGWGVRAVQGGGALNGLELKRCTRVLDGAGRFDPLYDEGELSSLPAAIAIVAIGQELDRSILPQSLDGVFPAGDLASGPRSVVEAIASGRAAALAVDRFLDGSGELELELGPRDVPAALGRVEGFATLARLEPPRGAVRAPALDEVAPGLGAERAAREADRCLRCDLRLGYRSPPAPPARVARLALCAESLERVPAADGVVRFYDAGGELLAIAGAADMRAELAAQLGAERAATFDFEPCAMYTQRQNELLGRYMEQHGHAPPGVSDEDDLDDLF